MNKWDRILKKAELIIGLTYFLAGIVMAFYLNQYQDEAKTTEVIIIMVMRLIIVIVPGIFAILAVMSYQPYFLARSIEKRLQDLNESKL